MCRIASHFLLQRLKRSMSGHWPTWASSVLITHRILRIWPPSDYHLFPGLKKQLKGRHFSSDAEVIAAAETWLDGQISEFLLSCLQKLEQRLKSVLNFMGSMLNKSRVWSL